MALDPEFEPAGSSVIADAPPRWVVRLAIGALALGALYFAATAGTPAKLPSIALKQELVYRGLLALAVLYGGLLIATPVIRGVLSGSLPTEITARGARYDREPVSGGLRDAVERIDQLTDLIEASSGHIATLQAELAGLRKTVAQSENRG